jgi:hypothetical protein
VESEKAILKMNPLSTPFRQLDTAGLPWCAFRGGVIPDCVFRVQYKYGVH